MIGEDRSEMRAGFLDAEYAIENGSCRGGETLMQTGAHTV
jgi:hypothetical protein